MLLVLLSHSWRSIMYISTILYSSCLDRERPSAWRQSFNCSSMIAIGKSYAEFQLIRSWGINCRKQESTKLLEAKILYVYSSGLTRLGQITMNCKTIRNSTYVDTVKCPRLDKLDLIWHRVVREQKTAASFASSDQVQWWVQVQMAYNGWA